MSKQQSAKMNPDQDEPETVTIGIFLGYAEDRFENGILQGVFERAQQAGAKVICFISGGIRSYHGFEYQGNVFYDLVNDQNVDALILSGAIAHSITPQELSRFMKRFAPLPIVGIGINVNDFPCLLVDSRRGVRDGIEHLILHHKRQRIVFIRGPIGQPEAEERFSAYKDVLAQYNIPLDESLVINGDFTLPSGMQAMQTLLAQGKPNFDAIVSANDSMAFGAIDVLKNAGIEVPKEVAVIGFDDTEQCQFFNPPLTTVRQSSFQQGQRAAEMVLALLQDKQVDHLVRMPSQLVIRQSCGCSEQAVENAFPDKVVIKEQKNLGDDQKTALRNEFKKMFYGSSAHLYAARVDQLIDDLLSSISLRDSKSFLLSLGGWLNDENVHLVEGYTWQDLISILRQQLIPLSSEAEAGQVENIFHQARVFISQSLEKKQAQLRIRAEQRASTLRQIGESLMTHFFLSSLLDSLTQELLALGIKACYLSLFDDPRQPTDTSKLVFAYDENGRVQIPKGGTTFLSQQLVPGGVKQKDLVAEALYAKDDRLGFVLFSVEPENASICSAVRGLLSNALQSVLLWEQKKWATEQLQTAHADLEQRVQERTADLIKINQVLEGEIAERKLAEFELRQYREQLEKRVEERTIQFQEANQQLNVEKARLQKYNYISKQLGDMTDLLQASNSIQEAGEIIALHFNVLFPTLDGALYLLKSPEDVEPVSIWGKDRERFDHIFAAKDCWALRRGKTYRTGDESPNPACSHSDYDECSATICIPLSAQGEHIGILHFCELKSLSEILSDDERGVLETIADSIALALANIRMRESLRIQSIRDGLTGLYNRRYLDETLPREIHRAERKKQSIGVIMFDIDHFKNFNDTFGHDAGDVVLKTLASTALAIIRESDIACRYGGEEFTLILPDTSLETAQERAEKLREGIAKIALKHNGQDLGKITISVGVAVYPEHGATRDVLIKMADAALYQAKESGRNRVVVSGGGI